MSEDRSREGADASSDSPAGLSASGSSLNASAWNGSSAGASTGGGVGAGQGPPNSRPRDEHLAWALEQVRQALGAIRFGQVVITVQDGVPIQIERTEKTRLR